MIDIIFKGIYDLYLTTNDFKTATNGRFYYAEAPQNTAFPYCVFNLVDSQFDRDFLDKQETATVQFNIVDNGDGLATVTDCESKMHTLFDDAILTLSGYYTISMDREGTILIKAEKELDDQFSYHNLITTYKIYIEKS